MNTQYNSLPYNAVQYNLTSFITVTLKDYASSSDALTKLVSKPLVEASILVDGSNRSISEKRLSDTLLVNDWLEIKENPKSDPWGD